MAERWISNVAGGPRRWLALTEPDESGLGGLGFLVLTLIEPVVRSISLPPGRTAASLAGLAAVAALFLVSQRMTTQHPWSWRVTVLAALTAISTVGLAMLGAAWVSAGILAAVAAVSLLPLMAGAAGGVILVTGLSAVASDSALVAISVAAAGVIAMLRGRLLTEIAQSRANRQAHAMAAVENERLRIARDLHDLLGHSLVTMVVQAELAERLAGLDRATSARATRVIQQVGRAAMLEVQQAVSGYRSISLADEVEHTRQLLRPLRNGVTVNVPARTWSQETDAVLAWGLREGVTNILRHANASRCAITVTANTRTVRLTLDNDDLAGGAAAGGNHGGGQGLVGLLERTRELKGEMTATPQRGGFRLALELPLDGTAPDRGGTQGGRP